MDLVERLRGFDMQEREMWEQTPIGRLAHEAADEIERLRDVYGLTLADNEKLKVEVERLRAGLREIVWVQDGICAALCDEDLDWSEWGGEKLPLLHDALLIARRLLGEEK